MKLLVFLNESAKLLDGAKPDDVRTRLVDAFTAAGAHAEVRIIDPRWISKHVEEGSQTDFDAILAAGDDHFLNTVANALSAAASRKPLGYLPLDPASHVARELEIPLEMDAAIRSLAAGSIVETFPSEINGRIFFCAAAVGMHPGSPLMRLTTRGRTVVRGTFAVVASNNAHHIRAMRIPPASTVDRGMLNIYFAAQPEPRTIVGRTLRAVFGQRDRFPRRFRSITLPDMRVIPLSHARRRLSVEIDGEIVKAVPPLHFAVRATPLRMLLPARGQ